MAPRRRRGQPIPYRLEGTEAPHPVRRRRRRATVSDVGPDHRRHAPGPEAVFALLLSYARQIGLNAADKVLFIADGAPWIWQRIQRLIAALGLSPTQVLGLIDLSCREATLGRGQAAPLERDATHPLAQPHAGAAQASTGGRGDHGPAGAVPRAHGRQDPHAPQLLPEEPSSFRLHHNGRLGLPRAAARRKRHPSRHQSPHQGRIIYWLPESVDAILLLRSFYKSGRWNCLQRMAMTPVGVSA